MKDYKYTVIGLTISLTVYLLAFIMDWDLFEYVLSYLETFEDLEIDELIIPLFIFSIFALVDFLKAQRMRKVQVEKAKIYKAMAASTNHVLNNFLNQMLLFQLAAEDTPDFDPETLSLYKQIIEETRGQVETLSNLSEVDETSIRESVKMFTPVS